jgi:2-dehydro-3-deoxyphosphogluconate aldolase / (4S)-4-hydroxy-2-oxoglutarate aldolase
MMSAETSLALITEVGIVPSVRATSSDDARFAAEALYAAGVSIVEVAMTTPQIIGVIGTIAKLLPDVLVGAGTVLNVATARRCIDAGAQFITSPGFARAVVEMTMKKGVLALPGAVTPTEVMAACDAGASVVKVFPAAEFGGPGLIRTLKKPFPQVRFIAAGGVNQQTAGDFIDAGAIAVGIGTELIPGRAIAERDHEWIAELVHRFRQLVSDARAETDRGSRP